MKNKEAFLRDLAALTAKHGIVIGGCNCCSSPWLEPAPDNPEAGFYRTKSGDRLRFIHPSYIIDWNEFGGEKP